MTESVLQVPMLVDPGWLLQHIEDPRLLIFDCTSDIVSDPVTIDRVITGAAVFAEGHVPGARYLDVQADLSVPDQPVRFTSPSPDALAERVARLGIGPDRAVVLYSTGDIWWATRVWWQLRSIGLDNVGVLDGGLRAWREAGGPVRTGPSSPSQPQPAAPATPRLLWADKTAVSGAIGTPAVKLVNALLPAKFSGAEPNRRGRRGHITSSVNLYSGSLLDPQTGRFLDTTALRKRFEEAGIGETDSIIAYCGAGIAASAVTFASVLQHRPDARVYDGSLTEWAVDEDLPMAVSETLGSST